jgi:branched-chain amino acid transport system permease protein
MSAITQAAVEDLDGVTEQAGRRARSGSRGLWAGLAAAVATLLAGMALPFMVRDAYWVGLAVDAVLLGLLALGIGFLARHLGLISLGHTAFFGSAAYTVAIATTHWQWAPTTAALAGVGVGTVFALVMGVLVVRASGMGFLMLTLALSQALFQLCVQTSARPLTGAYDGLLVTFDREASFVGLGQAEVMDPGLFWPVAWGALVVVAVVLWLLGRSRFGTVLEGIRENEERMRFSGYDTFGPRLAAFVVSGAVAALGGALFALNAGYVSPEVLGFVRAGDSLIAALVGGLGTLAGPVLGAALFVLAQGQLNVGGNLHLYIGIALIAVLVFLPGGITGAVGRLWRRLRAGRGRTRKDDEA